MKPKNVIRIKCLNLLQILIVLLIVNCFSQGIGINPTGANPNASAGLDIDYQGMRLLVPRMTTTQHYAISSPANSTNIKAGDIKKAKYLFKNTSFPLWVIG